MLRGINVDPLNNPPAPDELVTHRFNAVRLVMRPQGNVCERYAQACLARGIFVLGVETNASGGYMMSSVDAYQIGNEPDVTGVASDTKAIDDYVAMFNLFTGTYRESTGKPFIAAGLARGGAAYWNAIAPQLENCTGLALHPYGLQLAGVKGLIAAHEVVAPGMPVWVTEWNRPTAEVPGYDWWLRTNIAGAFWFCWGDWMVAPFGLFDTHGNAKPALAKFGQFNPDQPNTPYPPVTPPPAPTRPNIVQRILPSNCWGYGDSPGRRGLPVRFIVNHIAVGNGSLYGWFASQGNLSTHFWVGKNGAIEQYVPLDQAAYAQGLVTAGSNFPPGYPGNGVDYNRESIGIEREGYPSEDPTPQQWASIVALNRWLCDQLQVPIDGDHVIGHYRTDRVNRANCPSSASLNASAYMAKLVADVEAA